MRSLPQEINPNPSKELSFEYEVPPFMLYYVPTCFWASCGFKFYSEGIFRSLGTQQKHRKAMYQPSLAVLDIAVNLLLL
jgi:hypothetical protein